MEKIVLSTNCKKLLRELHTRTFKLLYPKEYYGDIKFLISEGLISAKEMSGKRFCDLKLTDKGEVYIYENPNLKNPSIWDDKKYWINTAISVIALIVAIIALFKN